ncbi:MAG: hypothetical protein RL558_925, partial [Bacteroidota bacterium]
MLQSYPSARYKIVCYAKSAYTPSGKAKAAPKTKTAKVEAPQAEEVVLETVALEATEAEASAPEVEAAAVEAVEAATAESAEPETAEDFADEDELELLLNAEEEEEAIFDWDAYEAGYGSRSEEHKAIEKLYEATLVTSVEHQVVNGVVVQITDRDVIIDISSKSEGVVSMNEFRYNPDLKVGDLVEVLVDKQEDKLGQLVLSHRKARSIKAWDRVN